MSTALTAYGEIQWDWPCVHAIGLEVRDLEMYWVTDAGEEETLDTGGTYTAYYTTAYPTSTWESLGEGALASNHLTWADLDLSSLSGIRRGAVRCTDASDVVRRVYPFILSVDASTTDDLTTRPTVNDLRAYLYDRVASDNPSLRAVEFSDRLLYDGFCDAARVYNGMEPNSMTTSTSGFSNDYMFLVGASAYVLETMSMRLLRNRLEAPGQVDKNQRVSAYEALASALRAQFNRWAAEDKRYHDIDQGWALV